MVAEAFRYAQCGTTRRGRRSTSAKEGEWGVRVDVADRGAAVPTGGPSDDNGHTFRYLYLQANPVVLWTALGALLLSCALLVTSLVQPAAPEAPPPLPLRRLHRRVPGALFRAVPVDPRRDVLYHFSPLLLTFVLFAVLVDEIDAVGRSRSRRRASARPWHLVRRLVASFWFYKPRRTTSR